MSCGFKAISLLKQQTLGTGAYGAVCKAKCDDLLCAAKLIYPVLFDLTDQPTAERGKEHRVPLKRFEQECQFLSQVRHPNVVQYLGTHRDPDSGSPALLMELMDESLTSFLDKQKMPVPVHVQVNLLHDIALALAYLHSNGIIHRDLSSNNVLLIGSSRAKVTDFGMSSLVGMTVSHAATLTMCPGTQVYMPPEALNEPPLYSEKLDCFSFGVLVIQVLTCQFPDPSNRYRSIEVCQPGNSSIRFQAQVLVPEAERRKNHISQVKNNSLHSIALQCLNDENIKRPTASDICQQLATLKNTDPLYHRSVQEYQDIRKSCAVRQQQVCDRELEFEKIISTKSSDIEQLNAQIQKLELKNLQLSKENLRNTLKLHLKEDQLREHAEKPSTKLDITWKECQQAPIKMSGGTATHDGTMAYFAPHGTQSVYQFDHNDAEWKKLSPCPNSSIAIVMINNLLTSIGGHSFERGISNKLYSYVKEEWVEEFPEMPTKRFAVAAESNKHVVVVAGGFGIGDKRLADVEIMDIHGGEWHCVSPLKFGFTEASVAIVSGQVYVGGGYSHTMEEYRVMKSSLEELLTSDCEWETIATLPVKHTTLRATGGRLLAFGGSNSNHVYSYDVESNSWEQVSSFQQRRVSPLVVTLPELLIVAGGNGSNRAVEVGISNDFTKNCSVM